MKSWLCTAFSKSHHTSLSTPPNTKSESFVSTTPLVALQLAQTAHWSGRDYNGLAREGYQRNAIAYRCIRLIAETAASIPFCVRRDGQCDSEKSVQDPVQRLLNHPNPKQSRANFFESLYGHLQLSGNGYLEAVCDDEFPIALFSLRPDRMRAITNKNGWPISWEYKAGTRPKCFPIETLTGQTKILHMGLFNPIDDIYGFSPLEAAAQAVDVHNAGGIWTKALLDNSARPSGALIYNSAGKTAERLSDEQFERLKAELETNHAGARAAGRPLLLEGGLDWKSMSMSPHDMDFINARREAAREIALAFGIPPMLLGIPGDNTYSNYKEANLAFWRQTILPLVQKTADSLGTWLGAWFGDDLSLHVALDKIPALSVERMQMWNHLKDINFMSEDEKRTIAGLAKQGVTKGANDEHI